MIGFELLFGSIKSDLKTKNDLIVAVVHWKCISKGFLCVGIGEAFPENTEKGSELLPKNWNQSEDTYILRYVDPKSNKKLLIKCVKVSDILIVSGLVLTGDNTGSTLSLKTDDYISNDFKSFDSAFTSSDVNNLANKIEKEVIEAMLSPSVPKTQRSEEQTRQRPPDSEDPLRVGPPRVPYPYGQGIGVGNQPYYGGQWPPPIGGADLDPLGRGQGGMLMDPRNFPMPFNQPRNPAPGLPPGAVPPGARFDPFGPPGVGPNPRPHHNPRQMGPDPDHLPPPGYDDMFM